MGGAAGAAFVGATGSVATNFAIFAQIYTAIFSPFQGAVNGVAASLSSSMAADVRIGVVAVIMVFAAALAIQANEAPFFSKLLNHVLLPVAVVLHVLANYASLVIQPAMGFAPSVGNSIVGSLGGTNISGGAPFDTVWNHAFAAGVVVMNAIPSGFGSIGTAIGMFFSVAAYWIVAGAAVGIGFALFMVSQAGLLLVLAIGPIFVGFGAFQWTRFLLKGFVSAVASIICAQVIVLALLALSITVENTIISPLMNVASNANIWGMVGNLVIVGILLMTFTVLALKASAYAVGICGGVFDGIAPWVASISSGARAAGNFAGAAGGMGSVSSSTPVSGARHRQAVAAAGRSLSGP